MTDHPLPPLTVRPYKTRGFHRGESLAEFVIEMLDQQGLHGSPRGSGGLREKDILVVTSKIVSLAENRVRQASDKAALVRGEADTYLGEIAYGCHLTIKHGLLIPSAGIDASNSETGEYILFPTDPFASAQKPSWSNRNCFGSLGNSRSKKQYWRP